MAALSVGGWTDLSDLTNVRPINDTSAPGGTPTAWLETQPNYQLTNWPGKMTWIPDGRLCIVGTAQGHVSDSPAGQYAKAVFFNVQTGQFTAKWNPFGANTGHVYDGNQSTALNGYLYRVPFNNTTVFRMNTVNNTWSAYADISSLKLGILAAMDVFPTMGAAGSIIWCVDGKVGRHDIATKQNSILATSLAGAVDTYDVCSYHPGIDAIVLGGGMSGGSLLHVLDRSGKTTQLTRSLPSGVPSIGPNATSSTLLLPDPHNRRVAHLVDFLTTGKIYQLDLVTGTWSTTGAVPGALVGQDAVCGGAVPGLGLVFFVGRGRADSLNSNCTVWACRVM